MPTRPPEEFVTVVSGLPRSGTSLMMAMLQAGGIPALTDKLRAPDADNARGYYEFEPAKSLARDSTWIPGATGRAVKIIVSLLVHLPPGMGYRIVLMRRDLDEVLASQAAMLARNRKTGARLPPHRLRELYEAELRKAQRLIETRADCRALWISYNELLADPAPHIAALDSFLGPGLDRDAMLAVIDPALYRQRAAASPDQPPASPTT